MVKCSKTNYYKKYDLTLKYNEQPLDNENNDIVFNISISHNKSKLFNIQEHILNNYKAYQYIIQNPTNEYKIYQSYEGIYIYLYYFEPSNKWFVSTKKQINNFDVYKAFEKAKENMGFEYSDLNKNYIYVFKLVSYKFIKYCCYSDDKYNFLIYQKTIDKQTNKIIEDNNFNNEENKIVIYEDVYKTIKSQLLFYEMDEYKNQNYVNYQGLEVQTKDKDNNIIMLKFYTDTYKYFLNYPYNYGKYRVKPKDHLFFSYLISKNENEKSQLNQLFKTSYNPYITSKKITEKINIINTVSKLIICFYRNKNKLDNQNIPKSFIYLIPYIDKIMYNENITDKSFINLIYRLILDNGINKFYALLKPIKNICSSDIKNIIFEGFNFDDKAFILE